MSTTTNVQSYLPYVFRPVYTWTGSNFTTTFNISNIDTISVNSATLGRISIGDSNQNAYIGCNAGNPPASATAFVTYCNTAIGVSAGAGISNTCNSEFVGYLAGNSAKYVYNTVVVGMNAGGVGTGSASLSNIFNSILIGTANSVGLSNISNTISIGGNAGGGGNWNTFMGTSNGIGAAGTSNLVLGANSGTGLTGSSNIILGAGSGTGLTGSSNIILGTNIAPLTTTMSNKFLLGSPSNTIAAGDFSNGIFVVGSTNTNAYKVGTTTPFIQTSLFPITLDVYNYARFDRGIGIGCDPAAYTLDVNGQFRVTDGFGQFIFSNVTNGTIGQSNSLVTLAPASSSQTPVGPQMTLSVVGDIALSGGTAANGLLGSITAAGIVTGSNVVATNKMSAPGYTTYQASSFLTLAAVTSSVTPSTPSAGQATYTTNAAHGFTVGQTIAIATGTGFTAGYMGVTAVILAFGSPAATTFVISNATTGGTTSGTANVGVVYAIGTTKNGLVIGSVYDQAGTANYHIVNTLVRSVGTASTNVSTTTQVGSLGCTVYAATANGIPANTIAISNTTSGNMTVGYNFTQFPTS